MVSPSAYTERVLVSAEREPSGGYLAGQSGHAAFASWQEDRSAAPLG